MHYAGSCPDPLFDDRAQLMHRWVPQAANVWPLTVALLEERGQPWEEEHCLYDLRWLYDRDGRVPSRRELVKRWNQTERVARRLLWSVDLWWDPAKGSPPVERPTGVPEASQERPTGVHTRADLQQDHLQLQDTLTSGSAPKKPTKAEQDRAAFDRLSAKWKAIRPGGPALTPTKGLGVALMARLRDHGEESVGRVLDWYGKGTHQRAAWLVENGHGLQALMRPGNFETYLGLSPEKPRGVHDLGAWGDDDAARYPVRTAEQRAIEDKALADIEEWSRQQALKRQETI